METDGRWVLESDRFNEPTESTRWLTVKEDKKSSGATDQWGNSTAGSSRLDLEPGGKLTKWITLNCYRSLTRTGDLEISKSSFSTNPGRG